MAFTPPPCLQMVPVEREWLSGPSEAGNLRVLMLGGQCSATPSLLSPGAWIWSPLPAHPLSPTVSGPHPPSSNLPPARLTAPLSPTPSQTPLPLLWDRLSPTWQGLAWISGIPGQVGLMRKVLSAWACLSEAEKERESKKLREVKRGGGDA